MNKCKLKSFLQRGLQTKYKQEPFLPQFLQAKYTQTPVRQRFLQAKCRRQPFPQGFCKQNARKNLFSSGFHRRNTSRNLFCNGFVLSCRGWVRRRDAGNNTTYIMFGNSSESSVAWSRYVSRVSFFFSGPLPSLQQWMFRDGWQRTALRRKRGSAFFTRLFIRRFSFSGPLPSLQQWMFREEWQSTVLRRTTNKANKQTQSSSLIAILDNSCFTTTDGYG